ncbi:MAG: hypothetical protein V1886_00010 [archaeon]
MGMKENFKELGSYMVPVLGDIKLHNIGKEMTSSKLERAVFDVVIIGSKYLALYGIGYSCCHILNDFYAWKKTADILKGI